MFHLYLVTDTDGSWPLLRDEPLAESGLPVGTAVVALLGRFARRETARAALALAREAVCGIARSDEADEDAAGRWLGPRAAPARTRKAAPRRSGRRWIPG